MTAAPPGRPAAAGETGVLVVVGAGPGIGAAVARRFGRQGFRVGLVARSRDRLDALTGQLRTDGIEASAAAADARDPARLTAALAELADRLGPPSVLCFSPLPDVSLIRPVLRTSPQDLLASFTLSVAGAAAAVQAVVPAMLGTGRGTLLFTTGSGALTPSADRAASAVTTSAVTSYVHVLRDALGPQGVQVAHLVIAGAVGPGLHHEPDTVAEHLWRLHQDPQDGYAVLR